MTRWPTKVALCNTASSCRRPEDCSALNLSDGFVDCFRDAIGTVFVNNRTQAVRLPLDVRLPEGVQKVEIRAKGNFLPALEAEN